MRGIVAKHLEQAADQRNDASVTGETSQYISGRYF